MTGLGWSALAGIYHAWFRYSFLHFFSLGLYIREGYDRRGMRICCGGLKSSL
jgi:hypothetical protein